jgi:acetyl esterase/lipase
VAQVSKLFSRIALAVAAAHAALFAAVDDASAQTPFYQATAQEIAGPPGTLIRQEPMSGAPAGANAYRVLYRSTNPDNASIAVSGIVIVPPGPAPDGGRLIVAWAHPTTGIVPHCAPSLAFFVFQQMQGAKELLEQGYVIAATDYPGLGTPGPHPYLVGASEARAVIDSVRVARLLPGVGNSNRYAVWGHSQGGQAALFTGLISESYAPELRLVGVAAAAPATDLATLMKDDMNTTGGKNLTAMTLWSWARIYGAPIEKVVAPSAMPAVEQLAQECIESVFDVLARARTGHPLEQSFLTVTNLEATEPWKSLLARNSPGALPNAVPVFIAQGSTDALVRPEVTRNYLRRLCAAGSKVRFLVMANVGHGFAGRDSAAAAVQWITQRFAGQPAPSDCGSN